LAGKVAGGQRRGFGIGQALAIVLARSGAKLAISDIDPEGRAVTEERLTTIGAPVRASRATNGSALWSRTTGVDATFSATAIIHWPRTSRNSRVDCATDTAAIASSAGQAPAFEYAGDR
jgi:NAD(P)-dependent dehydrogenase (short-subunit alcohol dehydrogenase family)